MNQTLFEQGLMQKENFFLNGWAIEATTQPAHLML